MLLPSIKYFWLYWMLLTLAAIVCVLLLFTVALGPLLNNASPLLFGAVLGASFGAATGFAQSFLLKKQLLKTYPWIIATALGWLVFWSLNMAGVFGRGYNLPTKIVEGLGHGILFGAILGTAQYLVLKKWMRHAKFWVCINLIIWPVCAIAADALRLVFHLQGPAEFIIAFPLSALFFGVVMHKLLQRQANAKEPSCVSTRH